MQLTTAQYDALERAIVDRRRIAVQRRGTEYVAIPERLYQAAGREVLALRHPTTGEVMTFALDDLQALEVVGA